MAKPGFSTWAIRKSRWWAQISKAETKSPADGVGVSVLIAVSKKGEAYGRREVVGGC
jgi:hypothetical protein